VRSGGPDAATLAVLDGKGIDVDSIEFVHFDDEAAAGAALRAGKIDIAPLTDAAIPPQGANAVAVSAANLVLEISSANGVWKDPATHRALLGSIDRGAVAAAATGDAARRADDLAPGSIVDPGYCATTCVVSPESLAAIKALGATSGTVHVDVPRGVRATAAGAELVRQLVAAGLPAEARPADSTALQATVSGGQLELALFGVVGLAPTPDPYLGASLSSIGQENLSGFASAEFDAGLAGARGNPDAAKRRASYADLEAAAMAVAPIIPLVTLGERFAVSKRVHGVDPRAGVLFDGTSVSLGR
jgi:ABC-type oligopeptide transport system substrate-binding subunit